MHTAHSKVRKQIKNYFHEIGKSKVNQSKPYGVSTIEGNRSMH